jgi:hypothetical protein
MSGKLSNGLVISLIQDEKKEVIKVAVKYTKQGLDAVKAIVLK